MKRQLFDQEETNPQEQAEDPKANMKINKEFADKFEKREQKKLLEKSKLMESDLDSEESEYSDEDEGGVLINPAVEQKFLDTIARIRANDPKLKNLNKDIFEDEDFDLENIKAKEPEEKPITFKSLMADKVKRRFGDNYEKTINEVEEDSDAEDEVIKETDVQLQRRLKADFLAAADEEVKSNDDLLQVKEKTKEQIQKEKEEFEKYALQETEKRYDEDNVLKQFWGKSAEKKLSAEDKFLRSYILGEKWREANDDYDDKADEEDLERESEVEEFEENYNFRFEERDGDVIRTYPRTIEGKFIFSSLFTIIK